MVISMHENGKTLFIDLQIIFKTLKYSNAAVFRSFRRGRAVTNVGKTCGLFSSLRTYKLSHQ